MATRWRITSWKFRTTWIRVISSSSPCWTNIATGTGGNVYLRLSRGDGFDSETWPVADDWGGSPWTWAADFNGDGLADIASAEHDQVYMKLSRGDGFHSETWTAAPNWGDEGWTWVGDFDGNGAADAASAAGGNVTMRRNLGDAVYDNDGLLVNVFSDQIATDGCGGDIPTVVACEEAHTATAGLIRGPRSRGLNALFYLLSFAVVIGLVLRLRRRWRAVSSPKRQ